MIAKSGCGISEFVHDVDDWLAEEFVAYHCSGKHVAAVEKQVRILPPNYGRQLTHTA
jgi:hypothetical protein